MQVNQQRQYYEQLESSKPDAAAGKGAGKQDGSKELEGLRQQVAELQVRLLVSVAEL